jgi:hypothetical protein
MNNFAKHFPTLANNPDLQGWMVSVLTLGAMFGKHSYPREIYVGGPLYPYTYIYFRSANVCRMKCFPQQ